ncbi:PEP-CTERM sorting domain-containing protein [Methylomonas paludis]|uniref:PEP-CTERM sorting domain-containing protein n=1 Tax=Methylomonas paludis TaxID=1173101 RepID=A0A975RBE3_9GAMM|nr:PEP-CTERM sorting domain-containing protein [Methylomonas paludis]QWF72318.1 PEP-CTERM sorting domain-containing protein [Methylomonas paludis]
MKNTLIAASLGLAIYLPLAEAEQFNFSYIDTADGVNLAGIMIGTLEADNNTVAVTSVQDVTFNGVAATPTPLIYNADVAYSVAYPGTTGHPAFPIAPGFPDSTTPLVTLDGSYMNFTAAVLPDLYDGFQFYVGNSLAVSVLGGNYYMGGTSYGYTMPSYVQSDWQMSAVPVSAVPLPTSLPLFATGLASMAWRRCKAV